MAPTKDPITGIDVNPILVERLSLDFDAAVTAWVLKLQGVKYNIIAQRLGTNPHRIGEVFRGDAHPEAEAEARRLLALGVNGMQRRTPVVRRQSDLF